MEPTKPIPEAELELTEDELSRIFFGSEESIQDVVPDNITDEDFAVDHIEKNIEKKTIKLDKIIHKKTTKPVKLKRRKKEKDPEEIKNSDPMEEIPIKKIGRPKKWSPEMIAQKKEENKRIAKLNRLKKQEHLRIAQLSGDHPTTEYEKRKRIDEVIKTKEEVEKHITEKRTTLKGALGRHHVAILDKKSKCQEHLYKISHLDVVTNEPIAICANCSKQKSFTPYKWHAYLIKHKKEL